MRTGETIAAVATAPGRGGVAVIRVSGDEAFALARRLTGREPQAGRIALVRVKAAAADAAVVDEAILLAFAAPHSYTGEDVVEFQCHGGFVTPRRVLEACFSAGARPARRGEFTERAFLNGRLDYDQAESVLNLIDAKTARAADAALEGLAGRKRKACAALYDEALSISTDLEHALDIDEGELPPDFAEDLQRRVLHLSEGIAETIRRTREGHILREGALVVLAGPPNAGKSSLMNALLEENRAIVSDIPGTTRDTVEEWLDLEGWPIRLVDTAGLRETSDTIEAEGVRRAEDLIARADIVLSLGGDCAAQSAIVVHAKCDLGRGEGLNVSAKTGEGLDELKRQIVARLAHLADSAEASNPVTDREMPALLDVRTDLATFTAWGDPVLAGNVMRKAAERLGEAIGATYSSDLLENLFSRFCVGK